MIRPGVPAPNLRARLGREAVRQRGGVEYRELKASSLVNRCNSPRVPFEWTVNPYRGCAMGCRYCYAAYTHEYLGLEAAGSFHSTIYAKSFGPEETLRRLAATARRGERVALGTATDPYQPGETELGVTRRFLECAAQVRGLRLGITTKGAIILRDLDLLARIDQRSQLSVQVSLNSLDAELLRRIEPWAPPPEVRLEVLRRLSDAGLRVGLSLSPILPGDHRPGSRARRAHRPRGRGGRAPHVGLALVPALADAGEVLRLRGPRVPPLPRGLPPRVRGREPPVGAVPKARRGDGAAAAREARPGARGHGARRRLRPRPQQLGLFSETEDPRRRATFGYRLLS